MKPRFRDLLRAAFSARPLGMVVPPNWVALAGFGLLGLLSPGFLVIGAGLEIGYLAALVTNPRFQRFTAGLQLAASHGAWDGKLEPLLKSLDDADRKRYEALDARCRGILATRNGAGVPTDDVTHAQALARLTWVYLRLLATHRNVDRALRAPGEDGRPTTDAALTQRLADLRKRLEQPSLDDDLRRSLGSQADIVEQRLAQRKAARETQDYVEADLDRIEEQVDLLREQSALQTDPEALSRRLDEIVGGLGGTTQFIAEQQKVYGAVEDLLTEPPPLTAARPAAKESQ